MDGLEGLRDIHLPEGFTRFPLGWGVWLFFALILFAFVLSPFFIKLYRKSRKRYALKILSAVDQKDAEALCKISETLRRICLIKHKNAVALSGENWAAFLTKYAHIKIKKELLNLLINAPYMPQNKDIDAADFEQIKNFALSFAKDNL